MCRLLLAAAAVGMLASPTAASARVVSVEAILPPGQSGHVAVTGVTSGTGSPHLYDQTDAFVAFDWRPFGFDQPGETEEPRAGVRITRDAWRGGRAPTTRPTATGRSTRAWRSGSRSRTASRTSRSPGCPPTARR